MTKSAIKGVNFERVMVMVLLFQEDPCAPVLYQVKILKDRGTEKSKITRKEESRVLIKVGSHGSLTQFSNFSHSALNFFGETSYNRPIEEEDHPDRSRSISSPHMYGITLPPAAPLPAL